jgi:hypothetical protein
VTEDVGVDDNVRDSMGMILQWLLDAGVEFRKAGECTE